MLPFVKSMLLLSGSAISPFPFLLSLTQADSNHK